MSEKTIKAVFDTQLFLRAAINRHSLPAKLIFDMADKYELVISQAIFAEIQDVLNRPKIRAKFSSLTDDVIKQVIELLSLTQQINPTEIPAVSRDLKDDIFLACAVAANASYIVSEDKDLLVLNPYKEIKIVNTLDFLSHLEQQD